MRHAPLIHETQAESDTSAHVPPGWLSYVQYYGLVYVVVS